MSADFKIAKLANELEDAGELGLMAATLLAQFLLAGSDTGAFSGTDSGFVWSKSMGDVFEDREVPIGIGKLKVIGSTFSAAVGVQMENGVPAHINLLFSFLGDSGVPQTVLEIDPKIAVLAEKRTKEGDPNRVIGYENPIEPFQIPLVVAALEFNFQVKDGGVQSALVFHQSLGDFTSDQAGIMEWDLNKVIVFPKLGKLGLYVDRFFVDFSTSGSTTFTGMFPEVYSPSWRGFGAKDITFLYPIDEANCEFVYGGAQGFLYGLDNGFSGNFNINYTAEPADPNNPSENPKLVQHARGEIELRNNQFVKSQVEVDLNMERILGEGENVGGQATGGTAEESKLANAANGERAQRPPIEIPANSLIRCQATFVWHELEEGEVLGADLILSGVSLNGSDSGLTFNGDFGRQLFWTVAFVAGAYYLAQGFNTNSTKKTALGLGLLTLFIVAGIPGGFFPEVDQFTLSQLGFRFINFTPKEGDAQRIFEAILGFRVRFKMEGKLLDGLEFLADKLELEKIFNAGAIFGSTAENISLEGETEVEISNIHLSSGEVGDNIGRLFERKDIAIKATKLPELKFAGEEGEKGTAVVPKVELISHNREDGKHWYGLGIYFTALTGPSVSLDVPAAGLIIYFYPEPDIDFSSQLAKEPGFTFLIPKLFLAKGVIDLARPIPAFEGTQNRVAVDVGILAKDPALKTQELLKIGNYKHRFNGEVAWGNAQANDGPGIDYDFYFVQVGYAGQSPLVKVGPIGLYGLDLLYGKNIAPGYPGTRPTAVGLANWILDTNNQTDPFHNIRDWPTSPSTSTWHPYIIWDSEASEYKSQRVGGFIIVAGSAHDKAESVKAEVLGLLGLDDFWMAVAAKVKVKPANLESVAIFAYDSGNYLFRLIFEYRINAEGKFVQAKVPLEIGSSKMPERSWLYIGHYDSAIGGPVILDFYKRFKVKFYLVYDSAGLENFGLMPIDAFTKPDIMGDAYGAGAMFQVGPYTFGPSAFNIKLYAAMGVNAAYGKKPHMLVGELYAGGYIQLKVLAFKFKLELLARLQGMSIEDAYRWLGQVIVKLNLPWPFDDIEREFDFVIQSDDFVPLPKVQFSASPLASGRIEAYARSLSTPEPPTVVPIDSVVSIAFNKPLYEILHENGVTDKTKLLLNDTNPNSDYIAETLVTDYQDLKYTVKYVHALKDFQVAHQPIGGGTAEVVDTMLASWETPGLAADGTPTPAQAHHRVLYLNTLFPPELQFNVEQLGAFEEWYSQEAQIYPCLRAGSVCIMDIAPRPAVVMNSKPQLTFPTILDDVVIRENGFKVFNPHQSLNIGRMAWAGEGESPLTLAYNTHMSLPYSSDVRFGLNLITEQLPETLRRLIQYIRVQVVVELRGVDEPMYFDIHIKPDGSPCGWKWELANFNLNPNLLSVALSDVICTTPNMIEGWVELEAKDVVHLVQAITIRGHDTFLTINTPQTPVPPHTNADMYLLAATRLRLRDLCLAREQLGGGEWETTDIGGGSTNNPPPPDQAVDTFIEKQLMEPNHEYTINYSIKTFAELYHDTDLENTINWSLPTTPDGAELRTIRFRTEAEPSQNVSKYLGFVYPGSREARPYAASAVPMITFKYQGLIRKIYEKHNRTLEPTLLDMNGNEIEATLVDVLETHSGGFDAALEELLAQCLPHVQTLPYMKTFSWAKVLAPDMRYSLQLTDDSDPDDVRVPFNVSFHTSRYSDFAAHTTAVMDLVPDAGRTPLANSQGIKNQLAAFMQGVYNGTIPSYDGAVEQFYRQILGQDGGRLGPDASQDYMTFLVSIDPADPTNELVWGVVLELVEPLIGKESVMLKAKADIESWQKRGIILTTEDYLILHDASASRVIVVNSSNGGDFGPFESDINLALDFTPEEPLRRSIADYVAPTFPHHSPAQQAATVAAALTGIKNSDPDIGKALEGETRVLNLALPED